MDHFADRLIAACRTKANPLCVGIDPRWESLPEEIRKRHGNDSLNSAANAFEEFSMRVIDVVAPLVPVVKTQSAFFEACGPAGMLALQRTLRRARQHGLLTILDNKRNDIATTASAYADAGFAEVAFGDRRHAVWDADALTVNPYLGRDAVEPFLQSARRSGRGIFVLVRTSNPGAGQFQDLVCDGRPVFMHVAEAVGAWSRENPGKNGFADVGAVVGATHPTELAAVRKILPDVFFLVPGFGAQGATVADVAPAFREDGLGAIVNSSRGIIFSYPPADANWEVAVEQATRQAIAALGKGTFMSRLAQRKA